MSEAFYIGAYWGARKETAEACSQRFALCLTDLAQLDAGLSKWCKKGRSRDKAEQLQIADSSVILGLLLGGRNRKDADRSVIPELGYSLGLWNGGTEGESAGIRLTCGAYSQYVKNSCVIDLPMTGEAASRMVNSSFLERLTRILVGRWDPDKVVASSLQSDLDVGWLTYVRSDRRTFSGLPSSSRIVPIGPGTLIVLTDELFSTKNLDHMTAAERVSGLLARQ